MLNTFLFWCNHNSVGGFLWIGKPEIGVKSMHNVSVSYMKLINNSDYINQQNYNTVITKFMIIVILYNYFPRWRYITTIIQHLNLFQIIFRIILCSKVLLILVSLEILFLLVRFRKIIICFFKSLFMGTWSTVSLCHQNRQKAQNASKLAICANFTF